MCAWPCRHAWLAFWLDLYLHAPRTGTDVRYGTVRYEYSVSFVCVCMFVLVFVLCRFFSCAQQHLFTLFSRRIYLYYSINYNYFFISIPKHNHITDITMVSVFGTFTRGSKNDRLVPTTNFSFLTINVFSIYFQSVIEFLKDLPSYDAHNFTLYNTDNGLRNCSKRPSIYLPTKDIPSEQSKFTTPSPRHM